MTGFMSHHAALPLLLYCALRLLSVIDCERVLE